MSLLVSITMANHTMKTQCPESGVLIYIDNSNIWINSMSHSAHKLNFINEIDQDHLIRININKLLEIAVKNRDVIRCALYGSEPPALKEYWKNVKECKICEIDVQVTRRSSYTNREREVDQCINLDMGCDIVKHRQPAKGNGTVILFTGDGGMISAVRRAVKNNWNVEVWSYQRSLAKVYSEEVLTNDKVKIRLLDDFFDKFTYRAVAWKNSIPQERSFVITFQDLPLILRKNVLKMFVESATKLLRLPVSGRYVKYQNKNGAHKVGTAHLALICNIPEKILKEDSRNASSKKINPYKIEDKVEQFTLSNKYFEKIVNVVNETSKSEKPFNNANLPKLELEKVLLDMIKEYENTKGKMKYDFTKDVYEKAEAYLVKCENFNEDDNMFKTIQKYQPIIRPVPLFLQDISFDRRAHSYPSTCCLEVSAQLAQPNTEESSEEGKSFQVVNHQRSKIKSQKYSDPCKYGYRCGKGLKCEFYHGDKEHDYFKAQPNPALRRNYKLNPCRMYNKNGSTCKFTGTLSYKCTYAHGAYCNYCKLDDDGGHSSEKCLA